MKPKVTIRQMNDKDAPFILALNQANVEVLSPMNETELAHFEEWAELFQVAEADGKAAAFLIALREGKAYAGENYQRFSNCQGGENRTAGGGLLCASPSYAEKISHSAGSRI